MNGRFLCFVPISSHSPQKSSTIHAMYYSQNQPVPAFYRNLRAASSRRSPPRCWGPSPCSRRSVLHRPSRAEAPARGRPVRTAASSSTDTGHRRLPPAGRPSLGPAGANAPTPTNAETPLTFFIPLPDHPKPQIGSRLRLEHPRFFHLHLLIDQRLEKAKTLPQKHRDDANTDLINQPGS
jgi:hypothetical protein